MKLIPRCYEQEGCLVAGSNNHLVCKYYLVEHHVVLFLRLELSQCIHYLKTILLSHCVNWMTKRGHQVQCFYQGPHDYIVIALHILGLSDQSGPEPNTTLPFFCHLWRLLERSNVYGPIRVECVMLLFRIYHKRFINSPLLLLFQPSHLLLGRTQ